MNLRNFIQLLVFCLALLLMSCRKADLPPLPPQSTTFPLSQAKLFFHNNAPDLRKVSLHDSGTNQVKSIDYNDILVPDWEKATYVVNDRLETYEIPIKNPGYLTGISLEKDETGNITRSSEMPAQSKLIIQKSRLADTIRQFVVTVSGLENNTHQLKTSSFDYYGNRAFFNGYLIISNLEGAPTAEKYQRLVGFVREFDPTYKYLKDDPLRRNFNNIIGGFDCYPADLKPQNH